MAAEPQRARRQRSRAWWASRRRWVGALTMGARGHECVRVVRVVVGAAASVRRRARRWESDAVVACGAWTSSRGDGSRIGRLCVWHERRQAERGVGGIGRGGKWWRVRVGGVRASGRECAGGGSAWLLGTALACTRGVRISSLSSEVYTVHTAGQGLVYTRPAWYTHRDSTLYVYMRDSRRRSYAVRVANRPPAPSPHGTPSRAFQSYRGRSASALHVAISRSYAAARPTPAKACSALRGVSSCQCLRRRGPWSPLARGAMRLRA